jgi:hypothetical protein
MIDLVYLAAKTRVAELSKTASFIQACVCSETAVSKASSQINRIVGEGYPALFKPGLWLSG